LSLARPELDLRRLVLAIVMSAATGAVIYWTVMGQALPALTSRLSPADIDWLGEAFRWHPGWVLATVAVASAILALPVLFVFRAVSGPFLRRRSQH
jgi:hypothetical protein